MPIITKVTTQTKNKGRYNVYLDYGKGEEFGFSVDEYVLVKFQLKKGKELDDLDLTEIQYADEVKKAYNLALNYLSYRMRSKKEVSVYLKSKDIGEMIIQEIIHKLEEQRYLDDLEFAKAYARTQIHTTVKGPNLIRQELKEKGIEQEYVDISLLDFSSDEQLQTALKIAEKMKGKHQKLSATALKQKIEQTLQQKGYSFSIVQQLFDGWEVEKEDGEEWKALKHHGLKAHRRYEKYSGWEYERRMKQALYRKGFSLEHIEKLLAELKDQD
ncbi:MAG TPA: recombination regulator RecX [Bacillus sp. (in: firmicutes)]|nr:recombination regulator RecX [Bacillus sp. (in: firmicutes)]